MRQRALWAAALALACALPARAAPVATPHVEAELVAEHAGWLVGAANPVALRLKAEPGWHTYWRNPGDSGIATTLKWTLPEHWQAGEIEWPYPQAQRFGDLTNYGYTGEMLHLVTLTVPAGVKGDQTVHALAKWLVCADICIPGQAELSLTLPAGQSATASEWAPRFAEARARLPRAEPVAATFALRDGEFRLAVDAVELAGARSVAFFPYANDLVNHGAPQKLAFEGTVARFAQAQSAYLSGAPPRVEGVLVVEGSSGASAYSLVAAPGEVATVTAPPPAAAVPQPGLWLVLGFALLGGLILNLMPCVFPVLSIKAVSVLESRRGDVRAERRHALAYTSGVVLSCVAAALAILLLREGGTQLGWGFQLQSPVFVAVLAYLMLALGLSMSGLVQFGTSLMGVGQGLTEKGGYAGSFFTGVLAVVVASPCTAPYMGVALGYALAQAAPVAVLVFATLGLGLALPFLLIGLFPPLGNLLPRPGAWMETFKQVMAFPLYLTVAGLLYVLGHQSGVDAVIAVLVGLVVVAFGLWAWSRDHRVLALAAGIAALGVLAHPVLRTAASAPAAASATSEAWSEARLAQLRSQHRVVFVNFTADWCITCKVNEKVVFEREDVKRALAAHQVAWLTADWTNPDAAITAALAHFGRSGVPLYLLYPPEGEPEILPQVLTPQLMIEALDRVSQPKAQG